MPHFTVEYTDNIKTEANIAVLLKKINETIIGQEGGAFPPGGTRSRAIELTEYRMADGAADYAFVHATLKIGSGRTDAQKKRLCEELFQVMKTHFAALFETRDLALSMELLESHKDSTFKHNNVHARFKKSVSVT